MQESVLSKTKRFFRKNDIFFKVSLFLFLAAGTAYAFIFGNALLKIVASLSLGTMIASFISNYVFNYLYGDAFKLTHAINEILYLFLGIPIMIIAIGYLPLSVYILFFSTENNEWIVPILIGIMVTMQISSFIYIIKRRSKEKRKNIFQFIKYMFDFKTRAEEQRKLQKQTDQIDRFYTDMEKVRDRVDTTMERSTIDFDEFDWKKVRGINREDKTEVICWNCKETNNTSNLVCSSCGVALKEKLSS